MLAALGDADQAVLRFLRTRGHPEPVETVVKALGLAGEYGAVWAGIGAVGASVDRRRRSQCLAAGAHRTGRGRGQLRWSRSRSGASAR